MSDPANQTPLAPAFVALYTAPGRSRPGLALEALAQRYELCEDLAQMLCEQASHTQFKLGLPEEQVLAGMAQALQGGEPGLRPAEAQWVVGRIAELLHWPLPEPPAAGSALGSG